MWILCLFLIEWLAIFLIGNSHNVEEFEINTSVIYKLFSVRFAKIILLTYFSIHLAFATIYESYCTFWYYSWVPLYYFS